MGQGEGNRGRELLAALIGAGGAIVAAVILATLGQKSGALTINVGEPPSATTSTVTVTAASGGGRVNGPTAQDTLDLPPSMVGTWKGVVTQGVDKAPVTLRLTGGSTGGVVGEAQYLHCTTALTLVSGGGDVEIEQSIKGAGSCEVDNNVKLSLVGSSLDYSTPAGDGVLTRQ